MAIVFINGILATKEDKQALSRDIIEKNIDFSVKVSDTGIQYVTTYN